MSIAIGRVLITTIGGGLIAAAVHAGSAITVGDDGHIYFNDTSRDSVYRIEADGTLTAVAGDVHTNMLWVAADGSLSYPANGYPGGGYHFTVEAPDGSTYATLYGMVVRVAEDGSHESVAGDREHGFRDGPASQARFDRPIGLAVDSLGSVYVADHGNRRVRRIDPDGLVSTVARSGWPWTPTGLTISGDRVYVLERLGKYWGFPIDSRLLGFYLDHPRVRVLAPDGNIEVVARVPGAHGVPYAITFLMIIVLAGLIAAGARASRRRDI